MLVSYAKVFFKLKLMLIKVISYLREQKLPKNTT